MAVGSDMVVDIHGVFWMSKKVPSTDDTGSCTMYDSHSVGFISCQLLFGSSRFYTAQNLSVTYRTVSLWVIICSDRKYTKGGRYSETVAFLK